MAAKDSEDVQLASAVHLAGGVDPVTFLRGTPIEQAVWLASIELQNEWREAARERSGGGDDER